MANEMKGTNVQSGNDREAERMKKMQASRAVRTKQRADLDGQGELWLKNAIMAKQSAAVLEQRILAGKPISPESMAACSAMTQAVAMLP